MKTKRLSPGESSSCSFLRTTALKLNFSFNFNFSPLHLLNHPGVDGRLETVVLTCKFGKVRGLASLADVGGLHGGVEGGGAGHGLVGGGQEDDLAVRRLGHCLHGLEVADLHGRGRRQNVGGLAHELGGLDLGLGGDNLGFTQTGALGSHGERLLKLLAEDNVLDEHALDLDTPAGGNVLNDLANGLGNLLAALNDVLQDTGTDDVAKRGLGALNQGLADIGDAEGGLVGADNVVVDDRGQVDSDVVLGHADLLGDLDNLDLDVDLDKTLAEGVDLDQTGVDSLVETAELGDEADVTLTDTLVRVGAADAAGNGTERTDARAEGVD